MTGPVTGAHTDLVLDESGLVLDEAEVLDVARAIATAVAPATGLTDVQASLLRAITKAMTDVEVDYRVLDPLGAAEIARVLAKRDQAYRQRIVQHMVLGELVLTPLPTDVAERVTRYAEALGVDDDFVKVARKYARGALGLAWVDLRRSGFLDRWDEDNLLPLHTTTAERSWASSRTRRRPTRSRSSSRSTSTSTPVRSAAPPPVSPSP